MDITLLAVVSTLHQLSQGRPEWIRSQSAAENLHHLKGRAAMNRAFYADTGLGARLGSDAKQEGGIAGSSTYISMEQSVEARDAGADFLVQAEERRDTARI
jgi:hypothetical protein